MFLSEIFKFARANLTPATAFFNLPFKPKSKDASPDLKLYAFLISLGANALNKTGKGIFFALILISAKDFSSILPSIVIG